MKLKLNELKVQSFVTKEMEAIKGAGTELITEAQNCTSPAHCYQGTGLFCPTANCPSDWNACGPTGLC